MTDKEQIMIDGVDVSGCEYLKYDKIGCSADDCYCRWNDCRYKQLACKTQECEQKDERIIELTKAGRELKQECEELKERNKKIEDDWTSTANRNLDIEMENAKLQEKVKAYEKLALHITCPHCNKELGLILNGSEENINLFNRYRKAFEEIEKLAIKTNRDLCNNCGWVNTISCIPSEYICGDIKQILDIINKVKGEE